MSELRHHKDGAVTVGPVDTTLRLVENLADFAHMTVGDFAAQEQLRRLAWFLGDRGEKAAAEAIMAHARVKDTSATAGWTPWGYVGTP